MRIFCGNSVFLKGLRQKSLYWAFLCILHINNRNSKSVQQYLPIRVTSVQKLSLTENKTHLPFSSLWCAVHSVDTVPLQVHSCIWDVFMESCVRNYCHLSHLLFTNWSLESSILQGSEHWQGVNWEQLVCAKPDTACPLTSICSLSLCDLILSAAWIYFIL